jgi:hypothetical protein
MDTKLILVDGHSSVGKSSVSKSVWKQLRREQPACWLHEECEQHPIREGEFRFGALDTPEGMELNRVGMLKKWMQFRESIEASGQVCVTEGCLLHAYDRYFTSADWGEIWRTVSRVSADEWSAAQAELRSNYQGALQLIRENPDWQADDRLGNALAVLAHTAYHLGEIRQALCTLQK